MRRTFVYIAALLLLGPAVSKASGEFKVRGVTLPGGAVRVADDRYRLPGGWEGVKRFLKATYKPEKYPRRFVVNQPGIKALHVDNPDSGGEWDGFNVYDHQGEVRIFILARDKK